MEEGLCYVNGAFLSASEAKVSIFDRGFTSGEGVYDVTRSFGHKLFKLDEHVARLYRSLKYTRIDCGMPADETGGPPGVGHKITLVAQYDKEEGHKLVAAPRSPRRAAKRPGWAE
jgi:hypothetical protein